MTLQSFLATLAWGAETLPFPTLLLYGGAMGLLWLFIEAQFTRTARALPGWRRPFPVLPFFSEVVVWLMRVSSWLLWLWVALFGALVVVRWLGEQPGINTANAANALLSVAQSWQQGIALLVGLLPPALAQMLPGL